MSSDPTEWSKGAASALAIGIDIGVMQDYSFMTAGGVWQVGGRPTIRAVSHPAIPPQYSPRCRRCRSSRAGEGVAGKDHGVIRARNS